MTTRRLGFWSAVVLVAIGAGYALALAAGFARHGFREPIGDPVLAVMEVLTLLAAPAIVTLLAAIHERAPARRRAWTLAALAFGTLCGGLTSAVHFIELTAARQMGEHGIAWPSRVYAAELLAWDVFLGLAFVFAAAGFERTDERAARRGLLACGLLCLAGTVGPAAGDMRLQLAGVAGYALVMPVVMVLLARVFARPAAADTQATC
jgi:hypothetical protein